MAQKIIVILGAGWAGLPLAHKLLKYTTPKVSIKVILVTPNDHFFWNVAATRGIIPGAIPDADVFVPIAPAFKNHTPSQFELVLGKAENLTHGENVVTIRLNDGSPREQPYDQLVIATGSRLSSNLPLKCLDTHESTLESLHGVQKAIEAARTILVSGAGATGLEVAGELAAKYGSAKSISLVMSGDGPLSGEAKVLASVKNTISRDLKKLGVEVLSKTRVLEVVDGQETGQTTIKLSDGSSRTVDCYLPLHGISLNLSFVPQGLLDPSGAGLSLDAHMRVKGTSNVWGIGDVGNLEPKQLTVTDGQIIYLSGALHKVLLGEGAALEPYKPADKTMIFLSLGKSHATGQVGGWKLWGFMVNYVKGRKLFVDTAKGYVDGKYLRHASM